MASSPTGDGAFDAPPAGFTEDNAEHAAPYAAAAVGAPADAETEAVHAEFGDDLVALKREVEDSLAGTAAAVSAASVVQDVDQSNIVGVGFGSMDGGDGMAAMSANVVPGDPALIVFTVEAVAHQEIVGAMSAVAGTRALSSVPVIQVPVGIVDAYAHRMRLRPAPGGISVGHFRVTAGTLGCLSVGLHAPRTNRLMVLSNNHVLADVNKGAIGDCISQPGSFDGGRCPADQIAILERFVPINFAAGAVNFVDCATGWAWPDRVRRELMFLSGGAPAFFRVGSVPVPAVPGMIVGKSGRTTQLRQGRVTAVGVSVNVNYGAAGVGHFRDQISITGVGNPQFSAGGDSGSLIWQWNSTRAPVGLLFAGGGNTTFGNRIDRVLTALDIRLFT